MLKPIVIPKIKSISDRKADFVVDKVISKSKVVGHFNSDNSAKPEKQDKRKKMKHLFKKGESGNPKGRIPIPEVQEVKNIMQEIESHGGEDMEVQMGGKIVKKKRALLILHKMFELGMQGNYKAGDIYLNRVIGKARETLDFNGKLTIEDIMSAMIADRRKKAEEAQEDDE